MISDCIFRSNNFVKLSGFVKWWLGEYSDAFHIAVLLNVVDNLMYKVICFWLSD